MSVNYSKVHNFCRYGNITQVQKLCNLNTDANWLFKIACKFKRLNIAMWALKSGRVSRAQIAGSFRNAVRNNNLQVMKWLHRAAAIDVTSEAGWAMPIACCHGYYKAVKWLYSFDEHRLSNWLFIEVCGKGHLRLAKWMQRLKDFKHVRNTATWCALQKGHLKTFKWLLYHLNSNFPTMTYPTYYIVDQRALLYFMRHNPQTFASQRNLQLVSFFNTQY
jgi:hypothetical protein